MDINTVETETSNTPGFNNFENTLNEAPENVPIQCETTPEASSNATEIASLDKQDHQRNETTEHDVEHIVMLAENNRDVYKANPKQTQDCTQESDEDNSTIVLDRNDYLKEETLELPAVPDLSEFCGNKNFNEDSCDTREGKSDIHDACCSGGNSKGEPYEMNFENEDNEDGMETVEVMTISEFIGCTDIGENVKYMLDPKVKVHSVEYGAYGRDCDNALPKAQACSGEDIPASGATGIQTITRKDSETDNVVVIIRPRSDSPSDSKHTQRTKRGISKNTSESDLRQTSSGIAFEDNDRLEPFLSFPTITNSNPESGLNNCLTQETYSSTQTSSLATELGENSLMTSTSPTEIRKAPETGVRRKRWVRQNSNDISTDVAKEMIDKSNGFNDIPHPASSSEEINIDELDPHWDAEDKLIWELLRSMKSVTKRSNDLSEIGSGSIDKDNVSIDMNNAKKTNDQERSDTSDNDHISLTNSEQYTSLDSLGEKEREKLISEKLHKRQVGGITCVTFLSPGYQRPITKFTPIQCKEPLKFDAKEFFQKGFESSRKDLSVHSKEREQANQRTLNSPKLLSPRFFSQQ